MKKVTASIQGMQDTSCATKIEQSLQEKKGVYRSQVSFAAESIDVWFDDKVLTRNDVFAVVKSLGYYVQIENENKRRRNDYTLWAGVLVIPVLIWAYSGVSFFSPKNPEVYVFILSTIVTFVGGYNLLRTAFRSLLFGRVHSNLPITFAILVSYAYSIYLWISGGTPFFEASAALTVAWMIKKTSLSWARKKGITHYEKARPISAMQLVEGKKKHVSILDLDKNDIVIVEPHDKVPCDGIITKGVSHLDESMFSGMRAPVTKKEGDTVFASSVNKHSKLLVKVTTSGKDTLLEQRITSVQNAQNSSSPVQKEGNMLAGWAIFITFLVALGFVGIHGYKGNWNVGIISAIVALAIVSPSLFRFGKVTFLIGMRLLAKYSLVPSSDAVEVIGKAKYITFDSFGTITCALPKVTTIAVNDMFDPLVTLKYAAIAAKQWSHPFGLAIIEKANLDVPNAKSFDEVEGGITVSTQGKEIKLGSTEFIGDLGKLSVKYEDIEANGQYPLAVAVNGVIAGLIGITDPIQKNAKKTIMALQNLGLNVDIESRSSEQVLALLKEECGVPEQEGSEAGIYASFVDGEIEMRFGEHRIPLLRRDVADVARVVKICKHMMRTASYNKWFSIAYNFVALVAVMALSIRIEFAALLYVASVAFVIMNMVSLEQLMRVKVGQRSKEVSI